MTIEHNMKERLVYCYACKLDVLTNALAPTCKLCGNKMYTVVYSLIDGKRITGVNNENK